MHLFRLCLSLLYVLVLAPISGLCAPSPPRFPLELRAATSAALPLGSLSSSSESASTSRAVPSQSTICGGIIDDANKGRRSQLAVDAHDCLVSVPFNQGVALRFLKYLNDTMQFQSTLHYLSKPPPGYQQSPIDLQGALQAIAVNVTSGRYRNQYAFETDVMAQIQGAHDTHLILSMGVTSVISFGSGISLVSASTDGVEAPKVYLLDDIYQRRNYGYNISAVKTIDGDTTVDFLTRFSSKNSFGMVESHADWNQLMYSPVLDILHRIDGFSLGTPFYPGNDLFFTFENGTNVNYRWLASYTGPLTTSRDFYNMFVLKKLPAGYNDVALPSIFNLNQENTASQAPPLESWSNATQGAYPANPVTVQSNLQIGLAGGVVTGYILRNDSLGVLSIPSFDKPGSEIQTFIEAINNFTQIASQRNVSRILVDLSGNQGGQVFLAFLAFASFFPHIEPFAGSRRRSHRFANVLGNVTNTFWANLPPRNKNKAKLEGDEWVISDRINAMMDRNFLSWAEYFGPLIENGDDFCLVERYNLTDKVFQMANFGGWSAILNENATRPFESSQIGILTDGQCGSACTLFLEMMTHEAGVRTVVVGGRPVSGPMQAASGSRGALAYDSNQLDEDFVNVKAYSEDMVAQQLPLMNSDIYNRDTGLAINYLGFNLRDQVRSASSNGGVTGPLQFAYLPAHCRIYYTLDSVIDASVLWHDAAYALWEDSGKCVAGSTGHAAPAGGNGPLRPPPSVSKATGSWFPSSSLSSSINLTWSDDNDILNSNSNAHGGLSDGPLKYARPRIRSCCEEDEPCDEGYTCIPFGYPENCAVQTYICSIKCTERSSCGHKALWCDFAHSYSETVDQTPFRESVGDCVPTDIAYFPNIRCCRTGRSC